MDSKNDKKTEHHADVWRQHLHRIDVMDQQAHETYALHLTRLKAETRRGKGLVQTLQQAVQQPPPAAKPPRSLFWILEK